MTDIPDLAARRVVMSSYLYYRRACNVMSDHEFDSLCRMLSERWDELEPIRQWQLGHPREIYSTGVHVKVTTYAEMGAGAWHRDHGRGPMQGSQLDKWNKHDRYGHWSLPEGT